MKAKVICIGDELLIGQTINTNAAWIGQTLFQQGIRVSESVAIADTRESILNALNNIANDIALVLLTGGLGPTVDDITKGVLCEFFNTRLKRDVSTLNNIEAYFARRNRSMLESNARQADLPESCTILPNPVGTASGMWFEKDGVIYVSMPGVPTEMKRIMTDEVMPRLKNHPDALNQYYKTVLTEGIGESFLVEIIREWQTEVLNEEFSLAYLPSAGRVKIRLGKIAEKGVDVKALVQQKIDRLYELIPQYIFGFDDDTYQAVIGRLLNEKGKTIATAESCTGGYLAHLLTSVPGASKYYMGSVISYANHLKIKELGVDPEDIQQHGAVSKPVVEQMASTVRAKFGVDYGIAFSGVAGPDGGSEEKPVGFVWIAIAAENEVYSKSFQFGTNRLRNIQRACLAGMTFLRKVIDDDFKKLEA